MKKRASLGWRSSANARGVARKMARNVTGARRTAPERTLWAVFAARIVKTSVNGFFARKFLAVWMVVLALCLGGQTAHCQLRDPSPDSTIYPRLRRLSLEECRALSLSRSNSITLSTAKVSQARAELREQESRFKVNTQGGLDPFTGQIRFYLSLDLERLLQLNRQARAQAKFALDAQSISQSDARNAALKGVTAAWYGLRRAENSVESASRLSQTSRALHVSADARFQAGAGELSGVLSSLKALADAEDAYERARQDVLLGALDLAQSCGYPTAEAMEIALGENPFP